MERAHRRPEWPVGRVALSSFAKATKETLAKEDVGGGTVGDVGV